MARGYGKQVATVRHPAHGTREVGIVYEKSGYYYFRATTDSPASVIEKLGSNSFPDIKAKLIAAGLVVP